MNFSLYASPQQIAKNETVSLAGIHALQNSILVLVDTTVPLLKRSQSENTGTKEIIVNDSDSEDMDSLGPVSIPRSTDLGINIKFRPF